uniref:Uncharacterized protein n=1 Tax=Rhizophora mucronata TaxID=61149 RepID=A0A2P2PAZ4_RHIMU
MGLLRCITGDIMKVYGHVMSKT